MSQALPKSTDHVPLKQLILGDPRFHLPSRLAWLMTDVSSTSGTSYLRRDTMQDVLGATAREIGLALRSITEGSRKLFEWDEKKRVYRCVRKRRETPRTFKARVQKMVDVKLGIAWVLRDLLEGGEWDHRCVPHSAKQFADQLGCEEKTVSRAMRAVLASGHFLQYRRRRAAPLYARFDCYLRDMFDEKYKVNPRAEDAVNSRDESPKIIDLFDSRSNKSRSEGVTNLGFRSNKSRPRGNKSRPRMPKIVIDNNGLRPANQLDKQVVSFGDESSSRRQPARRGTPLD